MAKVLKLDTKGLADHHNVELVRALPSWQASCQQAASILALCAVCVSSVQHLATHALPCHAKQGADGNAYAPHQCLTPPHSHTRLN